MSLFGKFFLAIGLSFFMVTIGLAQEGFSDRQIQVDSTALDQAIVSDIDPFNYVFPPANRSNQLVEALSAELLERSINFVKAIEAYDVAVYTDVVISDGEGKTARPIWVLVLVFILFLALAVVRLLFPLDFDLIVHAYFNERLLQQVSKEDNMMTSWPYVILYLIFSLALGLFIIIINGSFVNYDVLSFENYARTSLFVALLFIAKILLIRFISFVFELDRLAREYVAVLYLVYFNSMLFLMPFLILLIFVPTIYFKLILILFSVAVSILFVYRFVRTFVRLFGNLKFSVFYLILYLCTLEVAPILILVKTLSN